MGFRRWVETGLCALAGGVGSHAEERFRNPLGGSWSVSGTREGRA